MGLLEGSFENGVDLLVCCLVQSLLQENDMKFSTDIRFTKDEV